MLVPVAVVVVFVSCQHQEQHDLGVVEVQIQVVVASSSSPEIAAWKQNLACKEQKVCSNLVVAVVDTLDPVD